MSTKLQSDQLKHDSALSSLGKSAGSTLLEILNAVDATSNSPLRASAALTPDAKLYITASNIQKGDGVGMTVAPIKSNIPSVVASTIDFQTNATSGATFDISWPTSTVGQFRRLGLTVLTNGTIKGIFSAEAASVGALANAGGMFVKSGTPICYLDLECTHTSGKFKTAGSATNIIENKVGGISRIVGFGSGSSAASGSGSGIGDDLASLKFRASITDNFDEAPDLGVESTVANAAGYTDASLYDVVNGYYRLSYDATKTLTGTGTAMTISSAPTFTVKVGDMIRFGNEVKRITAVASQTSVTINDAFATNPSASACTVMQAVHTYPLNGFPFGGPNANDAFPGATTRRILMDYEDTSALNDVNFDINTAPVIAYSVSQDLTDYTAPAVRNTSVSEEANVQDLPSAFSSLYTVFYPSATSGSGAANILKYKMFFYDEESSEDGSILNQAMCMTDGTGTEINCAAPSVVSGKTRVVTTFTFPVGVNSGTANGAIKVYLNGQKIPRYIDATLTPDASYKEISSNTIELDTDYSAQQLSLEIVQDVGTVDASETNSTAVSQLQQVQSQGFQAFIDQSAVMTATTTTGAPVAGKFYSTISNRKPIVDLTANLKAQMGVERVMTQQIYQLQDEFGPNGEPVFGLVNDTFGQVRLVGSWVNPNGTNGSLIGSNTTNDYMEITFYGTGLNVLSGSEIARDCRVSVDGGSEGSNILSTQSSVIYARNYAGNIVVNAVSGLTLGVHTAKLRVGTTAGNYHFGFEVLNESSSIKVNPGSSYVGGKKLTSSIQNVLAYNSTFESGILGTRGGRVLVYQKADGSIAKAVQPVNASQLNLTSADHTNEEVARIYHFREFGAGRSDDFSSLTTSSSSRAFTLDDGTTTLLCQNAQMHSTTPGFQPAGINDYLTFTFVGTGLDVVRYDGTTSLDTTTVYVDGTSVGTLTAIGTANKQSITKIVSGLPYGTHTVRIFRTAAAGNPPTFTQFIVYQPKKPTLPSGAVELAGYNVMADYVANVVASVDARSAGVLSKSPAREMTYVGTWSAGVTLSVVDSFGHHVSSNTNTDYLEYTFFGTGGDFLIRGDGAVGAATVQIDGSAYTGSATAVGTGSTWTPGTSTYAWTASSEIYGKLRITGLTLGEHKIRFTKASGASFMRMAGMDLIVPIHSHKSNLSYDQQNTLPVGSQGISDNRSLSPIKDVKLKKNVSQAFGVTSGPSTTSVSFVPMPDMNVTHTNTTGKVRISYDVHMNNNTIDAFNYLQIAVDGILISYYTDSRQAVAAKGYLNSRSFEFNISPGTHNICLYWATNTGTLAAAGGQRTLLVEEVE